MVQRLFICEKPSLARAIADGLAHMNSTSQSKGRANITVGNDVLTWALGGHMYELQPPDHYDPALKRWSDLGRLPFAPDRWQRKANDDKAEHIAALRQMIDNVRRSGGSVVNVGDAEREGQLIIDEILEELGWDPFSANTYRVWVSSYVLRDVVQAIEGMFPNAHKRNLSIAANLRQRADWTHGLNLTRLYTTLARSTGADRLLAVGRVQTPTLKLVVDRDRAIAAFKPVDHYLPNVRFRHENGTFTANWIVPDDYEGLDPEGRLTDRGVADRIAAKVIGKAGKVESCETKSKDQAPPLPYSMSALQTECSAKLKITAQQTMDVVQSLYEKHKALTYPRTDSRHLPKSVLTDQAPGILAALKGVKSVSDAAAAANMQIKSAAWDDAKVSDHHAIIPTDGFTASAYASFSPVEKAVFDIVAKAFVAQFHPPFRYKSLSAVVGVEGERFKATGRVIVDHGWKTVYGASADDDEDEEASKEKEQDQSVPQMRKGDGVSAEGSSVASKRTTPPPSFTDGTLIAAMSRIERFVDDPEIKKKLREVDGIGTEATRAPTIEKLLSKRVGYLKRVGTKIQSTDIGRTLIDAVPRTVSDPGITAIWEAQLGKIEKGEADPDEFWRVLLRQLGKLVEVGRNAGGITIKGASVDPLPGSGGTCPVCSKGKLVTVVGRKGSKIEGKRYIRCDNWKPDGTDNCNHAIWPDGPAAGVKPMKGDGETCPSCKVGKLRTRVIGQGEHKGKTFLSCDAWKRDDPASCKHRVFADDRPKVAEMKGHGEPCKKCGKGTMRTRVSKAGKPFLSCDNWKKDGKANCDNVVWPDDGGGPRRQGAAGPPPTSLMARGRSSKGR